MPEDKRDRRKRTGSLSKKPLTPAAREVFKELNNQDFMEGLGNTCTSLCRHTWGYDSQDLAQDTAVEMLQHAVRFRGASSVKTWSHAIARNRHLDFIRREKVRREKEPLLDRQESYTDHPEIREALRKASKNLTRREGEVICLRMIARESIDSIANALGVSPQTVYREIERATNKLLKALEDFDL